MNRLALLPAVLAIGCRPDPGPPPDYAFEDVGGGDGGFLAGPDPYQVGVARLSFGVFYEGGASQTIPVDDLTAHYYIFENTYVQTSEPGERVEGFFADRLTPTGVGWWGGGIHWDNAEDLSTWTTLRISFQSADPGFADFDLAMNAGGEVRVAAGDYGYVADGEWHHLVIPLEDFEAGGGDLTNVTVPLLLLGEGTISDQSLLIDDLYLTQE